ncbi:MAG: putative thymidylate kinase [Methanosaeta sp. PtaU1.Bin112]|nr:MAG: putative thymidylate kinase [Methanosaeta sp. PtaU1.Bin112]
MIGPYGRILTICLPVTMRQPKCGTDARYEGYWADCGYPSDDAPELVSGDNLITFQLKIMLVKGLLVTLEGIDGSGKGTVAKYIAAKFKETMPERRLVLTAEPTTGQAGRILRAELAKSCEEGGEPSVARRMQELFLFMADHASHLAETVLPALESGAIVLSDRYADSTAAYQGVTLKGIVPDPVSWIQSISHPWNVHPEMTLLLLLDPQVALQRIEARTGREKFERLEFLRMVDGNFRRMAAIEPDRFVQIDAEQDAEVVGKAAMNAILKLMSNR